MLYSTIFALSFMVNIYPFRLTRHSCIVNIRQNRIVWLFGLESPFLWYPDIYCTTIKVFALAFLFNSDPCVMPPLKMAPANYVCSQNLLCPFFRNTADFEWYLIVHSFSFILLSIHRISGNCGTHFTLCAMNTLNPLTVKRLSVSNFKRASYHLKFPKFGFR